MDNINKFASYVLMELIIDREMIREISKSPLLTINFAGFP